MILIRLVKLESRLALRHPAFWSLVLLVSLFVYLLSAGVEGWPYPFSAGEWVRQVVSSVLLVAPLLSLCLLATILPELRHREPYQTTPLSLDVRLWVKWISLSFSGTLAVILGTMLAAGVLLLSHNAFSDFVLAGWPYVPGYLLYTGLLVGLWVASGMALAYLTGSRLWGLASPALFWLLLIGLFLLAEGLIFQREELSLILRYLNPWWPPDFSAFAPWGSQPIYQWWRAIEIVGIIVFLVAVAYGALGRQPPWRGVARPSVFLLYAALGFLLMLGGSGAAWAQLDIAPFSQRELLVGRVQPDRLYALDRHGNALGWLSRYTAFLWPPQQPLPPGLEDKDALRNGLLVLIYPQGRTYPEELEGVARRLRGFLERAPWLPDDLQLILWPDHLRRGLEGRESVLVRQGNAFELWVSDATASQAFLLSRPARLWELAAEVAGVTPVHRAAQVYLTLYLVGSQKAREIMSLLRQLADLHPAEVHEHYVYLTPNEEVTTEELEALKARWDEEGVTIRLAPSPGERPVDLLIRYYSARYEILFLRQVRQIKLREDYLQARQKLQGELRRWHRALGGLEPYEAWLILEYWARGEREGHERFIQAIFGKWKGEE